MPFKDDKVRKEYHKNYSKNITPEQKKQKALKNKEWWASDFGQYTSHRRRAARSDIEFTISFEDWLSVWKSSGHYEERSPTGYVMCRIGDTGPYSVDNVFIDTASNNKRQAWFNNKMALPTGQFYKDLQT